MRYRLRTLLILLAIGPPMLAGMWFYPQTAMMLGYFCFLVICMGLILKPLRFSR